MRGGGGVCVSGTKLVGFVPDPQIICTFPGRDGAAGVALALQVAFCCT